MKNFTLILLAALLCACASLSGTYSYIPIGPQNLSITVPDPKKMPVYTSRDDVGRSWASIGLIRIKNLPYNRDVITREVERIKTNAAKKGADAVIINQIFDEHADKSYPVTLAAYLVKYLDIITDADMRKIADFTTKSAIENASN